MTAEQLEDLGREARAGGVGVIPGVNFSISGAMLQMAALRAARFPDRWEVTGYAVADKIDAPVVLLANSPVVSRVGLTRGLAGLLEEQLINPT